VRGLEIRLKVIPQFCIAHFYFYYISYPKLKEKSFLDLKKNPLSMHVFKERYVKKFGKDICGSELYTLVVSFCSNNNIFFKNNYKIGLLKQNPR
jgi:hypothetical protein